MKFIFTYYPSCGIPAYSLKPYDGVRKPLNILPSEMTKNELFVKCQKRERCEKSIELDIALIHDVKERILEIGDDPTVREMGEIYDMLYEPLAEQEHKVSRYSNAVKEIVNNIQSAISIHYKSIDRTTQAAQTVISQKKEISVSPESGFFEIPGTEFSEWKEGAIVMQTQDQNPITNESKESNRELYVIYIYEDYFDDCMTTSYPIGLFFNREEAELFKQKVEDAIIDMKSDPKGFSLNNCKLVPVNAHLN